MCRVLSVCRSGYYAWRERLLSMRHLEDQVLAQKVKDVFAQSRQSYGSPRVHAALQAEGFVAGATASPA
jgi:putative transposase